MTQKYTGSEYTGMRKERRKIGKHFPFLFYLFAHSCHIIVYMLLKKIKVCLETTPIEKSAPHRNLSINLTGFHTRKALNVRCFRKDIKQTQEIISQINLMPATYFLHSLHIVTRNNMASKLARRYCLCYCETFSLVPDFTECTQIFVTEECSTLFVPPKIK